MNILYFIMLSTFVLYVGSIWIRFGVLPSISESYYRLPKKQEILFTVFCWLFAGPAIVIGLELTGGPWMFFAGAGIMFVGAAAAFKEDLPHKVHSIGAIIGIVWSQLSIAFDFQMYYINIVSVVLAAIIYFIIKKNRIWWIELVAFSSICFVLGMQLFK